MILVMLSARAADREGEPRCDSGLTASIEMYQYTLDLTRQKRREPDDLIS